MAVCLAEETGRLRLNCGTSCLLLPQYTSFLVEFAPNRTVDLR